METLSQVKQILPICRYRVYKKCNPSFSAPQLIVAPDAPAAVKIWNVSLELTDM